MPSLKDFLPADVETLVSLDREQLAELGLLRYLNSLPEKEQKMLHRDNRLNRHSLQSSYGQDAEKVSEALIEAWMHLERNGYFAPIPSSSGGWVRRTTKGNQEKALVNWALFSDSQPVSARIKTYASLDAYEVYRDLRDIITTAKKSIFVVDKYVNEDIFDLYFAKCSPGIKIQLLTDPPPGLLSSLKAIIPKFTMRPGVNLEARKSSMVHDRVIFLDDRECLIIGQSLKDAAKKPTYLIRFAVEFVSDMKKTYDDIWSSAVPL